MTDPIDIMIEIIKTAYPGYEIDYKSFDRAGKEISIKIGDN